MKTGIKENIVLLIFLIIVLNIILFFTGAYSGNIGYFSYLFK